MAPATKLRNMEYTYQDRLDILNEIEREKISIKAAAEKYGVSPQNIRYWRRKVQQGVCEVKGIQRKLTCHKGKRAVLASIDDQLKAFYDSLCDVGRPVSVMMIVTEMRRLSPEGTQNVSTPALQKRAYRWMKRLGISDRPVTSVAQNTRHDQKHSSGQGSDNENDPES